MMPCDELVLNDLKRCDCMQVSSAVAALNDAYGEGTVVYEEREAKDITLTQRYSYSFSKALPIALSMHPLRQQSMI